jgi:hypothetical protein
MVTYYDRIIAELGKYDSPILIDMVMKETNILKSKVCYVIDAIKRVLVMDKL